MSDSDVVKTFDEKLLTFVVFLLYRDAWLFINSFLNDIQSALNSKNGYSSVADEVLDHEIGWLIVSVVEVYLTEMLETLIKSWWILIQVSCNLWDIENIHIKLILPIVIEMLNFLLEFNNMNVQFGWLD